MKLDYNILWCEDSMDWFEAKSKQVERHITELGFLPSITLIANANTTNFDNAIKKSQTFDIILVDYKIDGESFGDKLIKHIRNHNVFAEVVFYSGKTKAELYKAVADSELDGVYVALREIDFIDKVKNVIDTTVRKVLDVNNMRGIVMAFTSVIDKQIFEIIRIFHDNHIPDDERMEQFRKTLLQRIEKRISEQENTCKDVNVDDPWDYLSSTVHFGSQLRVITLRKDILEKAFQAKNPSNKWYAVYQNVLKFEQETNPNRNRLAHESEKVISNEDGSIAIKIGAVTFDLETAKQWRADLIKQAKSINEFHEALKPK